MMLFVALFLKCVLRGEGVGVCRCMDYIAQLQCEGLDEYGHPVGQKGVRGGCHFVDYWLFEALGMVGVKADKAYFRIGCILRS